MMATLLPLRCGRYLSVCSAPVLIAVLLTPGGTFSFFVLDVEQKVKMTAIRISDVNRIWEDYGCENNQFKAIALCYLTAVVPSFLCLQQALFFYYFLLVVQMSFIYFLP